MEKDNMKKTRLFTLLTVFQLGFLVLVLSPYARADIAFSGSGSSGTLSAPSELWTWNYDGGAAVTGYLNNWGSPGVGAGVVASGETVPVYGMEVTFSGGGAIDPASILIGNGADCVGSTGGGTTFCTIGSPNDIWMASLSGPDTIDFLAQSPTFFLQPGQDYFVNVFFDGATPTSFTGRWFTQYTPTVPEPGTLSLLLAGAFFAFAVLAFRKKQFGAAV
jgi:PEP-CTERM motif